jgi:hypothetical protein
LNAIVWYFLALQFFIQEIANVTPPTNFGTASARVIRNVSVLIQVTVLTAEIFFLKNTFFFVIEIVAVLALGAFT